MGAAVAWCGCSLSAWAAVQHKSVARVSPKRVERRSFQQFDAGSSQSLYFACAARTRATSCFVVGQPFTARSS